MVRTWPLDFKFHFAARLLSVLGSQSTYVAFPLLALALLDAPQAAFVTAASYGSSLILGLPAGAWADRHDRRLLMILAEAVQLATMIVTVLVVITGEPSLWMLFLVSFVNGAMHAVFGAASTAAVPDLVHRSILPAALAANESRNAALSIVGPIVGAALFAFAAWAPFALAAITFSGSVVLLIMIRTPLNGHLADSGQRPPLMHSVREGLRLVTGQPVLRWALVAQVLLSFVLTGTFFANAAILSARGETFGVGLMAGTSGLFLLIGSHFAPALGRRWHVLTAVAVQGAVWSACLVMLMIINQVGVVLVATAAMWVVVPAVRVSLQAWVANNVQAGLRGRVEGTRFTANAVASPLGLVVVGVRIADDGSGSVMGVLALVAVAAALVAGVARMARPAPSQ